jgi:ferredoxin
MRGETFQSPKPWRGPGTDVVSLLGDVLGSVGSVRLVGIIQSRLTVAAAPCPVPRGSPCQRSVAARIKRRYLSGCSKGSWLRIFLKAFGAAAPSGHAFHETGYTRGGEIGVVSLDHSLLSSVATAVSSCPSTSTRFARPIQVSSILSRPPTTFPPDTHHHLRWSRHAPS